MRSVSIASSRARSSAGASLAHTGRRPASSSSLQSAISAGEYAGVGYSSPAPGLVAPPGPSGKPLRGSPSATRPCVSRNFWAKRSISLIDFIGSHPWSEKIGCDMSASATTPWKRGRRTCGRWGRQGGQWQRVRGNGGAGSGARGANAARLQVNRVEGMHVRLETETEFDVAVAVGALELGKVGLQWAAGRDVADLDAPLVHVQLDAVGVDPLEALGLLADERRELVAQDPRRLSRGEDLGGCPPLAAGGGRLVATTLYLHRAQLAHCSRAGRLRLRVG
eukprot:scaffold24645_cov101-Isochrysis_galbana.AAC.4